MYNKVLSLDEIKEEPFVIENILWDLEPKELMEPRQKITDEGVQKRKPIKGYIFYIDTMNEKPILFLMRHTAVDYAETLAKIDEIPQELLIEAVEENKAKAYFGMYPINKKVEGWLRKELGVL
ncbi:MAG: hypothetical protein A2077_03805 [Nitrospirae bacterium GWC2_46_6]|nr:MAG: hypothetical protein A2077_03805 [Nitrospirae bacterium GWC2_46_6]OGW21320.1 MAG: hypothetical protein A2Z82_01280 [Nitrospirae bacterium GWA2_46_11]OGW26101.1 MAG: hypothetical protein A2X55_03520 [Nitrospirae bacterium GWB2_47_37]HAK89444.1 hypothetical protein [Nitrospiraceae bacterium]HCL81461.1 hypothetical protein [Nitrospiraceae bacterium]